MLMRKSRQPQAYIGTIYYFCAKACKEKFDKDPEKFMSKEKQ